MIRSMDLLTGFSDWYCMHNPAELRLALCVFVLQVLVTSLFLVLYLSRVYYIGCVRMLS